MKGHMIRLLNHDEVIEETTGRGETPRQALDTATLERYPNATKTWRHEDDYQATGTGTGSLIHPDDEHIYYFAE